MNKTVKGKKPAANQAAGKTGRQTAAAAASRKKVVKKSPVKPSAKKPPEKKQIVNKPISKKPLNKKTADINPSVNKSAGGNVPGKKRSANKLFGAKRSGTKPSRSANSAVQSAARQKSAGPVDKRSRRAVSKAMRNKQAAVKRQRYHGGNYILYYILAGIIIITVLIILANTVLFRCKSISVSGNARYSVDEIVSNSGLELGKNLLHIRTANVAEQIVSSLAYIDSAEVKKSFPTGIEISVVEAERWFGVRQGLISAAVSYGGKIVEHGSFDDLPMVLGMDAESVEVGARLKSTVDGKNEIPSLILEAAESSSIKDVDEIDITDRFSIKMKLDNGRIVLELGTVSDVESKLKVAKDIIDNHIGASESVTIIVSNPTRATVHSNNLPGETVNPELPETPEHPNDPENPNSSSNSGQ